MLCTLVRKFADSLHDSIKLFNFLQPFFPGDNIVIDSGSWWMLVFRGLSGSWRYLPNQEGCWDVGGSRQYYSGHTSRNHILVGPGLIWWPPILIDECDDLYHSIREFWSWFNGTSSHWYFHSWFLILVGWMTVRDLGQGFCCWTNS